MNKLKKIFKSILTPRLGLALKEFNSISSNLEAIKKDLNSLMINRKIIEKGLTQKQILKNSEFKIYSQNGEDGILNYIFSKIGTTNKTLVEFGIENGRECNSANLIINQGWNGLLMDGNAKLISEANYYYNKNMFVMPNKVKIINRFITAENINKLLIDANIIGEIDLLSVDIDGNDYWVLKAIEKINPRVIIAEYNAAFGDSRAITIPYDSSFYRGKNNKNEVYFGVSLAALVKLLKEKDYFLVGCDSTGCNSFFIRKDVAKRSNIKELSIKEAYYPMLRRLKQETMEAQLNRIKNMKFVNI